MSASAIATCGFGASCESAEPVDYSMEFRRLRRADDPTVHGVQRDLVGVEVLEEESADGDDQHDGPVDADADEHADEHDVEETEQEHRQHHAPDEPPSAFMRTTATTFPNAPRGQFVPHDGAGR
jgi:hypothetical protein